MKCANHSNHMGCQSFAHATCFILQHQHIFTHCQSLHASATPVQLASPSHACSDGSYNPGTGSVSCGFSATGNRPQAWNFAPSPTHTNLILPGRNSRPSPGLSCHTAFHTTHTHGFDNKALLPFHNSLWQSIQTNQQSPPWLTQAKYRAVIRDLLRCMQTRGQPLKLRHIQTTLSSPYYAIDSRRQIV